QCGDHLVGELAREHAMTVDVRQLAVVVDDDVAWRDARGTHGADRVSGAHRHREQWSHLQKNTPLANAAVDPTMGSQRDTSKARVVEELPVSRQVSEACTSRATRIIRSRLRHRVAIARGRAWKRLISNAPRRRRQRRFAIVSSASLDRIAMRGVSRPRTHLLPVFISPRWAFA